MVKVDLLDKILLNTYTLDTLKKRVKALKREVNIRLFGLKTDPKFQDQEHTAWINSLGEDFFNEFDRNDFEALFEQLDKKISEIQPLVIYFSYEPGLSQTVLIGGWLRENMGKNFIFDIKVDYSLIGGCAFVWKGVYRDYSIKARIAQNKGKLLENFRVFLSEKRAS